MAHLTEGGLPRRIVLAGNPNAGKSTLFNALTGGHAGVGNWHGVTVGVSERRTRLGGMPVIVCDLPGIYAAEGASLEEQTALAYLHAHGGGTLFFVAECETLPRALPLLFALAPAFRGAALVLTKRRRFVREGGRLDEAALSAALGLPVFAAEGGRREIVRRAQRALVAASRLRRSGDVHAVLRAASYRAPREGLSRFDRLLCNEAFAAPFFLILLAAVFFFTFASGMPGDLAKGGIERLFFEVLAGAAQRISSPVLRSFLIDGVLRGVGGVLSFLPQIALLSLALILLEESGLFSRLAMLCDGALARVGLNGRTVFSLFMGFGCTAAAILATRGLEERRVQRRVMLCLPYLPCSAKLPVFLTLSASFFSRPFFAVLLLYAMGVLLALLTAYLLRGKGTPPLVLELAPLQLPRPLFVAKSLCFQLKQFIIKTATVILAFFLASWLLMSFDASFRLCGVEESMLARLCGGLRYLFAPVGMCDWRIAYAALSGLIAKENVAGAISVFYGAFPYAGASAFAFAVFVLACSPCVSAIAACAREAGKRFALAAAAGQTASALLLSYISYYAVRGGIVPLVCCGAPLFAAALLMKGALRDARKKQERTRARAGGVVHERVRRHAKLHARRVHR